MIIDGMVTQDTMFYVKDLEIEGREYEAIVYDEDGANENPGIVEIFKSQDGTLYMGLTGEAKGITVTQRQALELADLLHYYVATDRLPYGLSKRDTIA